MSRSGQVLVIVTMTATAFAIVASFASFWGLWAISSAVLMWVILFIYDLITTSRLKKSLDKLMSEGEWVRALLTGDTEADYDRCEDHILQWNTSVDSVLNGTEYDLKWKSNVGLVPPEDLSGLVGLPVQFAAERNYMALRLSRLKEIRDSLSS